MLYLISRHGRSSHIVHARDVSWDNIKDFLKASQEMSEMAGENWL